MARGRMLDSGIWRNEKFAEMPDKAQLLMIGLISCADDQGRFKAHAGLLSSTIFPYSGVPPALIQEYLELIERNGAIILYKVDGKQYAQLSNWWEYQSLQFASPSDHPAPEGWVDRIRYTMGIGAGRILTFNWHRTDGTSTPDTCDKNGKPLSESASSSSNTPQSTPVQTPVATPVQTATAPNRRLIEDQDQDYTTTPLPPPATQTEQLGGGGGEAPLVILAGEEESPQTDSSNTLPPSSEAPPKPITPMVEVAALLLRNGFGDLKPAVEPQVDAWLKAYPLEIIEDAIRVAVANSKTSLNYVEGVLKGNGKQKYGVAGGTNTGFGFGNGANHASNRGSDTGAGQQLSASQPLDADTIRRIKEANRRVRDKAAAATVPKLQ